MKKFQILAIDDGSTDGTMNMINKYFPSVISLQGHGNWWWGGSLHHAYKYLRRHVIDPRQAVLITNDDVEFEADFLQNGLDLLGTNSRSLVLARSYSRLDGTLQDSGVHVNWQTLQFEIARSAEEINVLSTRGLFVRLSDFFEIGGFHPVLIPHYQSDYEFTHRAFNKGFALKTFDNLYLQEDPDQTGTRSPEIRNLHDYLHVYFSKRSTYYLLSWVSFIALACPWRFKVRNFARILKPFFKNTIHLPKLLFKVKKSL